MFEEETCIQKANGNKNYRQKMKLNKNRMRCAINGHKPSIKVRWHGASHFHASQCYFSLTRLSWSKVNLHLLFMVNQTLMQKLYSRVVFCDVKRNKSEKYHRI